MKIFLNIARRIGCKEVWKPLDPDGIVAPLTKFIEHAVEAFEVTTP